MRHTCIEGSLGTTAVAREGCERRLAITKGRMNSKSIIEWKEGMAKSWIVETQKRRRMLSLDVRRRGAGRGSEVAEKGRGIYRASAATMNGPKKLA
jgi:hypothetical protein